MLNKILIILGVTIVLALLLVAGLFYAESEKAAIPERCIATEIGELLIIDCGNKN